MPSKVLAVPVRQTVLGPMLLCQGGIPGPAALAPIVAPATMACGLQLWPVPAMQGQRKAGGGWALSTSQLRFRLRTVATSLRLSPGDLPVSSLG